MFPELPGAWAAVVVIALTPAALRWWWGRALSRLADDPVLPERLAAHNRRFLTASGGCLAGLVVGGAAWALLSGALLLLAPNDRRLSLRKMVHPAAWRL